VLAGGPDAPGARHALGAFTPRSARVLLTGAGLGWLADPEALERLRACSRDLALCSQSARDQGLTAARTPAGVRWSSLATWMVEQHGAPFQWVAP
jgi:hypothetical protein